MEQYHLQALLQATLRAPGSQPHIGPQSHNVPAPYLIPQLDLSEVQVQAQAAYAAACGLQVPPSSIYGHNQSHPITDAQVAQARLNKQGHHRPLGRTQSAPLPLGHPMLTGIPGELAKPIMTHYENCEVKKSNSELSEF